MLPATSSSPSSSSSSTSTSLPAGPSTSCPSSSSSSPCLKMPTTNDFNQTTAKQLLRQCATLIVENFPPGSEFGIDTSIHYTGDRFLGLKMIPPGLHFVHWSHVNRDTDSEKKTVAPRIGFFHYFNSGDLVHTRWDAADEDVVIAPGDAAQLERFKDHFTRGYLDHQLGAYQFDRYQTWVSLTDYISPALVRQMNPACGKIFSASRLVYRPNQEGQVDQHGLPDMVVAPEAAIGFVSKVPKHFLCPDGASAGQRTQHSLDSSYTLDYLVKEFHGGDHFALLGELQFTFVAYLLGHVYEAFESWLDLLRVLCSTRRALSERPDFYLAFIRVLHFQLKQSNEAIFTDIVEQNNLVYHLLRTFILNIRTEPVPQDLATRGEKFRSNLTKTFKWRFEDELDDEKPVLVIT